MKTIILGIFGAYLGFGATIYGIFWSMTKMKPAWWFVVGYPWVLYEIWSGRG